MIYQESDKKIPDRIVFGKGDEVITPRSKYKVQRLLGKGGYGDVYLISAPTKQQFALKILRLWEVLPREYEMLIERFQREYEVGQMNIRGILHTHFFGKIGGNPFMILDYCAKGSLEDHLNKFQSENYALSFSRVMLLALSEVHDNQIIHRDIKPANILFNHEENPNLADFGISGFLNNRLTSVSFLGKIKNEDLAALGNSPGFSPPEQFNSYRYYKKTLPSMDIYSFAATLFYAVSGGQLAFGPLSGKDKQVEKYLNAQKSGAFRLELLRGAYATDLWISFFKNALHPNPSSRFGTCRDILEHFGMASKSKKLAKGDIAKAHLVLGNNQTISLDELVNKTERTLLNIGRSQGVNNDISIDKENKHFVSRKHATFELLNGEWYIRDGQYDGEEEKNWRYSSNGVKINGEKLLHESKKRLNPGDIIHLGNYKLKFN